jgi:putative colanic acid biosynthesis UDP-glucose lipid carrier transferase
MRHHVTPAYFVGSAPRLSGFQRAPEEIGALPVFALKRGPLSPSERAAKRLFDVVVASLAVFTLAPLLLAVAIALRASGAKSPFVRLRRRGFDGREFWLLAFADGPGEPGRVRRLMRSTGVNALPQLLNVIAGDLSLVGPRALSAGSSDEDRKVARFAAAQGLKPGLAQGFGGTGAPGSLRGAAARDRSRHDDLAYLDHWSLGMDIAVLATSLGRMCIVRDRQQA